MGMQGLGGSEELSPYSVLLVTKTQVVFPTRNSNLTDWGEQGKCPGVFWILLHFQLLCLV